MSKYSAEGELFIGVGRTELVMAETSAHLYKLVFTYISF